MSKSEGGLLISDVARFCSICFWDVSTWLSRIPRAMVGRQNYDEDIQMASESYSLKLACRCPNWGTVRWFYDLY